MKHTFRTRFYIVNRDEKSAVKTEAAISAYICPACDNVHIAIETPLNVGFRIDMEPDEIEQFATSLYNPATLEDFK